MKISPTEGILSIAPICAEKGVKYAVISPGSRNAPLIVTFSQHPTIECFVIADERSAAFFALGLALKTNTTVALICTSGSATLNYAPGIVEAYYQKIPLLVLTADRPIEWIDQGEGQSMRQKEVYRNYIRKNYELPQEVFSKDDLHYTHRILNDAINTTHFPVKGPVHINIPLKEPLYYESIKPSLPYRLNSIVGSKKILSEKENRTFADKINSSQKVMLLVGQLKNGSELNQVVNAFAELPQVAVLTETTSNLKGEKLNSCIDRVIFSFTEKTTNGFLPEILITIGDAIISKKIKALLRKNLPQEHWHISENIEGVPDTYQALTHKVEVSLLEFFASAQPLLKRNESSTYGNKWNKRHDETLNLHQEYLSSVPFSDLKVFEKLLPLIPENSEVHFANSTAIRYAQLFDYHQELNFFGNRGVSGIDGCTSTAVGFAVKSDKIVTLVTGDIAFFYDSNAFWNKHITANLRIILINNSGGNIFRIIEGPDSTDELEEFFEAKHSTNAAQLCQMHNVDYRLAKNEEELSESLNRFYDATHQRPQLLEIVTPNELSAQTLRNYTLFIREHFN